MNGSARFFKIVKQRLSDKINTGKFPRVKIQNMYIGEIAGLDNASMTAWKQGRYKFRNLEALIRVCEATDLTVDYAARVLTGRDGG